MARTNANDILNSAKEMMEWENNWENPFGDRKSGEKIVEILVKP